MSHIKFIRHITIECRTKLNSFEIVFSFSQWSEQSLKAMFWLHVVLPRRPSLI